MIPGVNLRFAYAGRARPFRSKGSISLSSVVLSVKLKRAFQHT